MRELSVKWLEVIRHHGLLQRVTSRIQCLESLCEFNVGEVAVGATNPKITSGQGFFLLDNLNSVGSRVTVSRSQVNLQVVEALHAVGAVRFCTGNVSAVVVADTREQSQSTVLRLAEIIHRHVHGRDRLLLDVLGLSGGARQVQMLCSNMFFETRLGPKGPSTSATAIPLGYTLAWLDVKVAADELSLLGVHIALVNIQIALLGEAASAVGMIAYKVPALVDGSVLNFDVSLQVTVRGADLVALVAGGGMVGSDVLLHLNVGGEANGSSKDDGIEARIQLGHFGGTDLAPVAVAAVFTVLVANEVG